MTMRCFQSIAIAAFVASCAVSATAQTMAPADLAKANPELVGALATELGATPAQAAGAAGALFGVAKDRLPAGDWSKVSAAVPGIDQLLAAAPVMAAVGGSGGAGAIAGAAAALGAGGGSGGASNLLAAAGAFQKLGLDPGMVAKAVPVLNRYVTKVGGAGVGSLLAGVLK